MAGRAQIAEGPLRLPEPNSAADAPALPPALSTAASPETVAALPAALPQDLQAWLDEQERSILVQALQDNGFNRTATAARLGISLRQIRYRIERLGIDLPSEGNKHHGDHS